MRHAILWMPGLVILLSVGLGWIGWKVTGDESHIFGTLADFWPLVMAAAVLGGICSILARLFGGSGKKKDSRQKIYIEHGVAR